MSEYLTDQTDQVPEIFLHWQRVLQLFFLLTKILRIYLLWKFGSRSFFILALILLRSYMFTTIFLSCSFFTMISLKAYCRERVPNYFTLYNYSIQLLSNILKIFLQIFSQWKIELSKVFNVFGKPFIQRNSVSKLVPRMFYNFMFTVF